MSELGPIAVYTKTWHASGAGLFAQELVTGMVDAGARVIFIAPRSEDPRFERPRAGLARLVSSRERARGGKVARIVASLARIGGGAIGVARARLRTRVLIVSVPDPLLFALPILLLLRLSGARIVYVVHDPVPHSWRLPRRVRWLEAFGYRSTYQLSAALVVLSMAGKAALVDTYRIAPDRTAVIEHGTFVLGKVSPAPGNGRLLLFGTLRRNKGIREAIEGVLAARAVGAAVRLVIAGAPDPLEPAYWAECRRLAAAHPDAVELDIGFVPQERVDALVNACDAFLLPYRDFHSQSGVAMLAASNARAIIASCAGGIGDLIADGMAGVPIGAPGAAGEIAAAIAAFVGVPIATWNGLAQAYRAKTLESRSWTAIGREYAALARKVRRA